MSLLDRTLALKRRAAGLSDHQARMDEASLLQARITDLKPVAVQLDQVAAKAELLQKAGLKLDAVPGAVPLALKRLERIRTRFADSRQGATLTKGQDWEQALSELRQAAVAVLSALEALWKGYVDGLYTGEPPTLISTRLAKTDKNQTTFTRYQTAYSALQRLGGKFPTGDADLESVRNLAHQLGLIAKEFDHDVPAAVKSFLDAVALGGASLHLVTDEVRAWLVSNRLDDRYRVVAVKA